MVLELDQRHKGKDQIPLRIVSSDVLMVVLTITPLSKDIVTSGGQPEPYIEPLPIDVSIELNRGRQLRVNIYIVFLIRMSSG